MTRDLEINFISNFECSIRNNRSRISLIKQLIQVATEASSMVT